MKLLLHAGCGPGNNKPPSDFDLYREIRLDADLNVKPDICASIVAMPMIKDGAFDAIFCSHTLEHLYSFEVSLALREFSRVLRPGGLVRIHVPDLQSIGGKLALDELDHVAYISPCGPICPIDMIYGHQGAIGAGNLFMAHKTGFTKGVITRALERAGFHQVHVRRDSFEMEVNAVKCVPITTEVQAEPLPTLSTAQVISKFGTQTEPSTPTPTEARELVTSIE